MNNSNSKLDNIFKKGLVVAVVAMVIFILIAAVLFVFRGPDLRSELASVIVLENSAIEFNDEAISLDLRGRSLQTATTANALLSSIVNEQIDASSQFGRALESSEVSSNLSASIVSELEDAKNSNRLEEFYDQRFEQILSSIEQSMVSFLNSNDNQTLQNHLDQITLLKESI